MFRLLDPEAFEAAFARFAAAFAGASDGVAAIDGKALRGAYERGRKATPLPPVNGAGASSGGRQNYLTDSADGRRLLSTVARPRREAMIRRLNAEVVPERKFAFPEMVAHMQP